MNTTTIAIIGATEKSGTAIAKALAHTGKYRLLLMAHDRDQLADLSSKLKQAKPPADIHTIDCAKEASWEADVIIVATPDHNLNELAERIREVATGKIVISAPGREASGHNLAATRALKKLLPMSRVVSALTDTFDANWWKDVVKREA